MVVRARAGTARARWWETSRGRRRRRRRRRARGGRSGGRRARAARRPRPTGRGGRPRPSGWRGRPRPRRAARARTGTAAADSTCTIPLSSCVWSGAMNPPAGSIPMPAGTGTGRPSTKTCSQTWMWKPVSLSGGRASDATRVASEPCRGAHDRAWGPTPSRAAAGLGVVTADRPTSAAAARRAAAAAAATGSSGRARGCRARRDPLRPRPERVRGGDSAPELRRMSLRWSMGEARVGRVPISDGP